MVTFAFAGAGWIVGGVIFVLFLVVVFSLYTYRGSGIGAHPHGGGDGAPGASGPSDPAGKGRIVEDPDRRPGDGTMSTRGTR